MTKTEQNALDSALRAWRMRLATSPHPHGDRFCEDIGQAIQRHRQVITHTHTIEVGK